MSLRYKDKDGNETLVAGGPFLNERTYFAGSYAIASGANMSKLTFVVPPNKTVVGSQFVYSKDNVILTVNYGDEPSAYSNSDVLSYNAAADKYICTPIAFTNTTNSDVTVCLGYARATNAATVIVRYTIF